MNFPQLVSALEGGELNADATRELDRLVSDLNDQLLIQRKASASISVTLTADRGIIDTTATVAVVEPKRQRGRTTLILTSAQGCRGGPPISRTHALGLEVIGIPDKLDVHGLRKLAATALAEAGCSTHEIASVSSHRTLAMISLYTASVRQEELAEAAIIRLETAYRKRGN